MAPGGKRSVVACVLLSGWLTLATAEAPATAGSEPAAADDAEAYGRTPPRLVPYGKTPNPYRQFYMTPPLHRGPGRGKAEPDVESVRIGVLAPLEASTDLAAGAGLKHGVELALEEANAAGGYAGIPFELIARNDQALWGSSSNTLVELAYVDRVWAMIGSIDSNSTHVALRAALKAELPIVNVGSTDPTMTETGIPWIVRVTPDDRQTGYRLAERVFEERDLSRVAVIRGSDRYGRFGVKEFRDAARRLGRPLPMELLVGPRQLDFTSQLERLEAAETEAVVLWLMAGDAGRLVRQMRARGIGIPVLGADRLATQEFIAAAGDAGEGVEATVWFDPAAAGDQRRAFRERFRQRFGAEADAFAAYGYDACRLVINAVRRQGLNRARIRDDLTSIREYQGVAGPMLFDPTSNNVAPVALGRVEGGRFVVR